MTIKTDSLIYIIISDILDKTDHHGVTAD